MVEQNPDRPDEHQIALRILLFAVFGMFAVVILLYLPTIGGGSGLLVHPRKILDVLRDVPFVAAFGIMLLQGLLSSLIGGALGVAAGALIRGSASLSEAVFQFLRVGLWLPPLSSGRCQSGGLVQ